jgi:hypothetical protein
MTAPGEKPTALDRGTTMPVTRDSPSIQGDVPGQTPSGLPLARRSPRRGSLVGGSRRGSPLPAKVRDAVRRCPPRAGRAWSTFGLHVIGTERFATVSSGTSFAQVAGAILGKRARVQNPDKDEVADRGIGCADPAGQRLQAGGTRHAHVA